MTGMQQDSRMWWVPRGYPATRTGVRHVSRTTTARGVLFRIVDAVQLESSRPEDTHHGGCLCMFPNELGLVLGLHCVFGGRLGAPEGTASAYVSGTTASNRKELIVTVSAD